MCMKFEFKKDKYQIARGNYSRLTDIFCIVCKEKILTYQKDGSGRIKRLYFDRILSPKNLTSLESEPLSAVPALRCPKCKEDLGTPYIYRKENRKAFKVYQDTLLKKIRRLNGN